jgi:hypothetical protein
MERDISGLGKRELFTQIVENLLETNSHTHNTQVLACGVWSNFLCGGEQKKERAKSSKKKPESRVRERENQKANFLVN